MAEFCLCWFFISDNPLLLVVVEGTNMIDFPGAPFYRTHKQGAILNSRCLIEFVAVWEVRSRKAE